MVLQTKKRALVGLTGASGSIYGVRLLRVLREMGIESHLIATCMGREVTTKETGISWSDISSIANCSYAPDDLWAPMASGSFKHNGLIILPCSAKTLGAIANGIADNLLTRAADVCLKEGYPLVLGVRETPLSYIHLENMLRVVRAGGKIMPPAPGFYHNPQSIDDLVAFVVGKALDLLGIENDQFKRWG